MAQAAAAAAWVQFVQASSSALAAGGGSGALEAAGLRTDLATAVDGVVAQGLAPLVPAQLLGAAASALQAHLAQLRDALAAVSQGLAAAGEQNEEIDTDEVEDGQAEGSLMPQLEASLVEVLRVRRAAAGRARQGQGEAAHTGHPAVGLMHTALPPVPTVTGL